MEFKILNWNIAGSCYLEADEDGRAKIRAEINTELKSLVGKHKPHVVTLQEIIRYGSTPGDANNIIDELDGYKYFPFPLIDSQRLSCPIKWARYKQNGNWARDTFFAQGNAIILRDDILSFPIMSLPTCGHDIWQAEDHFIEQVHLESGLYFGDRGTEPRAVQVVHLIFDSPTSPNKPIDIFVVNVHLTTLKMEREGIPEIDSKGSRVRKEQLDVIFEGIISRYMAWRQKGYDKQSQRKDRLPPIWIISGDFNFTPESEEYELIERMNFIDVIPSKGTGTKSRGRGKPATITVDYIFAGPKFVSLDPLITSSAIVNNQVCRDAKVSDHYPMIANIPVDIRALDA